MTKPLAVMLQLFGLILLMHGYVSETLEWVTLGLILAIVGAIGYRRRRKVDTNRRQ